MGGGGPLALEETEQDWGREWVRSVTDPEGVQGEQVVGQLPPLATLLEEAGWRRREDQGVPDLGREEVRCLSPPTASL